MTRALTPIPEWRKVDAPLFQREIVPLNKPAVLKDLVADWPAVVAAKKSSAAFVAYLKRFDIGRPAPTVMGDPEIKGRFFYKDGDLGEGNFTVRQEPIWRVADWLLAHEADPEPSAVSAQSIQIPDYLPGFERENVTNLPHASSIPRIWIGNAVTIATHFDFSYNIACVVAGHRRFTLFPPEQLPNLYVGPLDRTPAASPMSMASLDEPDFARFPRFEQALDAAFQAELEAGDALYIPYTWWHHVKSLDAFNVLVNYWWNDAAAPLGAPFNSLLHAMLAVRHLPADQRAVWRLFFDHYVFGVNGDPAAHLNPSDHGILGPLSSDLIKQVQAFLLRSLGG